MLKHRVQNPPPATPAVSAIPSVPAAPTVSAVSSVPAATQNLQVPYDTPHPPGAATSTVVPIQPRSETPTQGLQARSQTPTNMKPRSETPTLIQPRSDSFSLHSRPDSAHFRTSRSGSFNSQVPQSQSEYSMSQYKTVQNDSMSMSASFDAKEGVKRISERYDSYGNLNSSPYRSPASSTGMDGFNFSFTDIISSQKFREGMDEQDMLQIETFYKSHKTEVFVCGCLANLYFGSSKSQISNEQWAFSSTGIPLLLLDTGEHRRERKLYILLAEKGTGFTLWRDTIDKMTGYRTPNPNFHTMRMSNDRSKVVGFSFDDAAAAAAFYNTIDKLTADPNDELLVQGKIKKKKSVKDKTKKLKLPKKSEISQPCCFVHVTKLDKLALSAGEGHDQQHLIETEEHHEPQQQQQQCQQDGSEFISQPYNFQHMTENAEMKNNVTSEHISNMVNSKLTINSDESADSGVSDDRHSAKKENS